MESIVTEKKCSRCKEIKNVDQFSKHKQTRTGLRSNCKACDRIYYYENSEPIKKYGKAYRTKHSESLKKYFKKYHQENKEEFRNKALVRKYGITSQEYEDLLASQNERCAICKTKDPGGRFNKFHTDHDHQTGKVRGLLCGKCNSILGYSGDEINVLQRAIQYLRKSNG